MSMFDPTTGVYSDASFGIDTHAALADEPSVFGSLGNVVQKGVPLIGLSIVNSFANTAIDVGNWFGLDNKRLSMEDELGDGDYLNYYKDHAQGVEAAGLIAGSLIPGTIALKALRLLKLGASTSILTRATNILSGPKQKIIDGALEEVADKGSLFQGLTAAKYKAIALGAGDQALQGLVYEMATAATMKASPLLDQDGLTDTLHNMIYGAAFAGIGGGLIEGIGIRSLFNKALLASDKASQATATYLGKGGFLAGDRVVSLLDSLDAIPEQKTTFGIVRASRTRDNAILASKKILSGITGDDAELTGSVMDTLLSMREEGGQSKEQMFSFLARLNKVDRIGELPPEVDDSRAFYINRFVPGAIKEGNVGWDDLVTGAPRTQTLGVDDKITDTSTRYALKEGASKVQVARAATTFSLPDVAGEVPLFTSAKEAFEAGHDIFIDKNLRISVNPQAPNIEQVARPGESRALSQKEERTYRATGQLPPGKRKSLSGASLVLNLADGNLSTDAAAVVGDFGKPQVFDKGLSYGNRTSLQSLASVSTKDTSTIESNARYVWAALRGVQRGDSIAANDIPMLEQMYREGTSDPKVPWSAYIKGLEAKRVTFADGSDLPASATELASRLQAAKNDLIHELLTPSNGNAVPKQFTDAASQLKTPYGTADATGLWFLDGKKQVFAYPGGREELALGSRAAELAKYPHVDGSGGNNVRVWYKPGEEERAKQIAELMSNTNVSKLAPDAATEFHSKLGRLLGYSDSSVDAYIGRSVADKLSSEEVALRANVTQDYIANGFVSSQTKDFMVDPDSYLRPNHARLTYDIGNIYQQDGQILRGMADVQHRIDLIQDAAKATVAKHFGEDFANFLIDGKASDADVVGAGSGLLTFANAPYGSLGSKVERVGRFVTAWHQKQMERVSTLLAPHAEALRADEAAAAELGFFRAVRQRTNERYSFLPDWLARKEGLAEADGTSNIAVLDKSFTKDRSGNITGWDKKYVPENGNFLNGNNYDPEFAAGSKGNYTFYRLSSKVADFERANQQLNDTRILARNNFYAASGLAKSIAPGSLYTPPVNTSNYRHFAYVKFTPGAGMAESDVAVLTGETAGDLDEKIAAVQSGNPDVSVYTKDQLKMHHEVQGDYEYSRNFAQSQVNSLLARKGILTDVFPETRAEGIIKDYVDWHSRQEMLLTRDMTELGNSQLFTELREMGKAAISSEISQVGWVSSLVGKSAANPFDSYVKTALAISNKDSYPLWAQANEVLQSTFDKAFAVAKGSFVAASKGILPYEEASQMAQKFGLGNPYGTATATLARLKDTYENIANKLPPQQYLQRFTSVANSILGSTVIKLDTFQQFIHLLSTPILTLTELNSARTAELQKLLTTEVPDGSGRSIPAVSKLFFKTVADYWKPEAADDLKLFEKLKLVNNPDAVRQHWALMDNLSLPEGRIGLPDWEQKISNATAIASKLTLTNFSEQYTSWMAAKAGKSLFEAAGYEGQDLIDRIVSFANRVKGNHIASQRPVAFQGPLGAAMGLFQSYQFNLMQQLFRYVENGEAKTIAIGAGLQTTLFGMQSLPGWNAINQHLIATAPTNPFNKDLYSSTQSLTGKALGDYLLYGVTSNWLNAGLFTRGDINPRQITLLPTNPLDFPAISGGIRFVSSFADAAQKIAQGGPIASNLLVGLEHNGLSRPLQGLAALMNGYATTSKGSLISQTRPQLDGNSAGLSDLVSVANFSRLLGARPLDEAIAMDETYRSTLYKAKDNERMEKLGEAVKSSMMGANQPTSDQVSNFAARYAALGGNIQHFGQKMAEWSQDANASMANKVFRQLGQPRAQQAQLVMGGQPLPDFRNSGSTRAAQVPGARQGADGATYAPDPSRPGSFVKVE